MLWLPIQLPDGIDVGNLYVHLLTNSIDVGNLHVNLLKNSIGVGNLYVNLLRTSPHHYTWVTPDQTHTVERAYSRQMQLVRILSNTGVERSQLIRGNVRMSLNKPNHSLLWISGIIGSAVCDNSV